MSCKQLSVNWTVQGGAPGNKMGKINTDNTGKNHTKAYGHCLQGMAIEVF